MLIGQGGWNRTSASAFQGRQIASFPHPVVRSGRLELPAFGFVDRCSVPLSYERKALPAQSLTARLPACAGTLMLSYGSKWSSQRDSNPRYDLERVASCQLDDGCVNWLPGRDSNPQPSG